MKVRPPFIGFASPALAVWHLFARVGSRCQHVAFMVMGGNRWGEPKGSIAVQCNAHPYREEDLQRWSEFDHEENS